MRRVQVSLLTYSLVATLFALCIPRFAGAQDLYRPAEPTPARPRPAGADSARFLPRWLHLFGELGAGWIAAPQAVRQLNQPGMGGSFGIAADLAPRVQLRCALDTQIYTEELSRDILFIGDFGLGVGDTSVFHFESTKTVWRVGPRLDFTGRVWDRFWLHAGGSGSLWKGSPGQALLATGGYAVSSRVEAGPARFGLGYFGAVRWDFDPAPQAPLYVMVVFGAADRGDEALHEGSIRLGYRGR